MKLKSLQFIFFLFVSFVVRVVDCVINVSYINKKGVKSMTYGVTGFEPATTRPPDAYSNRAELHPELRVQR